MNWIWALYFYEFHVSEGWQLDFCIQHTRDTRRKRLIQTSYSYSFHALPIQDSHAIQCRGSPNWIPPDFVMFLVYLTLSGSISVRYWPASSWKLHGSHMAFDNPCVTQLESNLCYTCCKARGLVLTLFTSFLWMHVSGNEELYVEALVIQGL
jgi:hypothetical protein